MANDEEEDLEAILAAQIAEVGQVGVTVTETISPPIDAPIAALKERAEVRPDEKLMTLVTTRFRPDIVRHYELPQWVGELPFHLDPVTWRTGFLEVYDGGPPLGIREGLRENVPQASLRDLFRPEYSNAQVPLERLELALDPGGRAAFAEVRAARTVEPPPRLELLTKVLAELRAERDAFFSSPWPPFLPDDAPRRDVHVLIEPSLSA